MRRGRTSPAGRQRRRCWRSRAKVRPLAPAPRCTTGPIAVALAVLCRKVSLLTHLLLPSHTWCEGAVGQALSPTARWGPEDVSFPWWVVAWLKEHGCKCQCHATMLEVGKPCGSAVSVLWWLLRVEGRCHKAAVVLTSEQAVLLRRGGHGTAPQREQPSSAALPPPPRPSRPTVSINAPANIWECRTYLQQLGFLLVCCL